MAKYGVECTIIYNGRKEVEAENEAEAIEKVREGLYYENGDDFPNSGIFGGVDFNFGEATADYAEKVTE